MSSRIEIEQVSTQTNSQRLPGLGRGEASGGGESADPARAAESEHRHPADVAAEPEPRPDPRFEAGRGYAGGRDEDHSVDVGRREPGAVDAPIAASSNISSDASR